ncbi:hypothetical protein D9599_19295 [Roseomonas sp. KE2513]|uniref:SIR2 family protein n=1 Tax=Roseomonas sp. KE2513 TaxID=2479202 RepID=UPI0018E01869|nr:SIR2 family protein [Roseomonas sp. KE2513]MBI0537710.1 hypothetical protein [Roseomonas sp. KE2513]
MDDISEGARLLASLFRADQTARPVLLLGAGASFSSGVPTARECVSRIARRFYADRVARGGLPVERVKVSEWMDWLASRPWFVPGEDRFAENFPLAVEHLLTPQEYKREVLLDLMVPRAGIKSGYRHLAEFVVRGLVKTILTTNFDRCIPEALSSLGPHVPRLTEVNKTPGDLQAFDMWSRAQLVWLHGTAEHYTDRNLHRETEQLDDPLVSTLRPLLGSSPLVVIGYRGAEASIMEHLLGDPSSANGFKRGIYWCLRKGEEPHASVEALRRKVGSNFRYVTIAGFDELIGTLAADLVGEDCYPSTTPRSHRPQDEIPFDDQPLAEATEADVDEDLALSTLIRYCEAIGRAPVTRSSLKALLAELQLVATHEGRIVPTRGCILLFGKDPQRFMPHAVVEATIAGKKRQVFSGNLLGQREALQAWLDSWDVNPVLKVKAKTAHEDRRAVPELALTELAANALLHRDYAIPEPVEVDAAEDGFTFRSPGALPAGLARRVQPDSEGRFQPLRLHSEPRNRSLCDVFFGLHYMQRHGTGLADVEDLARGNGGRADFRSDSAAARFEALLRRPLPSGGSREVARDQRQFATYVLNTLPFAALPSTLTVLQLRGSFRERPRDLDLSDAGTFAPVGGNRVVSFVPLPLLAAAFGLYHDPSSSLELDLAAVGEGEWQDELSWLLRRHFEQHVRGLRSEGLILEAELPDRRSARRAYFVGDGNGKPRDVNYLSGVGRRVRRQTVKDRGNGASRPWFENEGFGYAVVRAAEGWGIRIKPFYMFTGADSRTPLPPFMQGSRATRRVKFDRNKNVEDDLTFWARFIGRGQPVIDVGQQHVGDLLLQGSFLTCEVPL